MLIPLLSMHDLSTDLKADAILSLMDDPSLSVRDALIAELTRMGSSQAKPLLKRAMTQDDELAYAAEQIWETLYGISPEKQFERYITEYSFDLETSFLVMSQIYNPDLETYRVITQLDDIADIITPQLFVDQNDWDKCRIISRVIFKEFGFGLNKIDPQHPCNWYLSEVLRNRSGVPLSLAVLYVLVALRCRVDLELIRLPSCVMIACFSEGIPLYIDPVEQGTFRSQGELMNLLYAGHTLPKAEYFAPVSIAQILIHCCRELSLQYRLRNNTEKAALFNNYLRLFEARNLF